MPTEIQEGIAFGYVTHQMSKTSLESLKFQAAGLSCSKVCNKRLIRKVLESIPPLGFSIDG